MFTLYIPQEQDVYEKRVAATPETVRKFQTLGFQVMVEKDAGAAAFFSAQAYQEAGATICEALDPSLPIDVVLTVRGLTSRNLAKIRGNSTLIGLLGKQSPNPAFEQKLLRAFNLELLPRISRAQTIDALSSQSTIAGYWAVLEAAHRLPRLFPLLMTAAGTIAPARVLVLGAGVAGLQAIATARRLGALVAALDVRPAAKEQVESLGAEFVQVEGELGETKGGYALEMGASYQERQVEKLRAVLPKIDVVIGTALIPGKPAPRILSEELMALLKPGAVVIDLAVEAGGNCAMSCFQETVTTPGGVTLVGEAYAPSQYATDASALYARNMLEFIKLLWDPEKKVLRPTESDELLTATCIYENLQESPLSQKINDAR